MPASSTIVCELTGKPPDDREWLCECRTCCEWRVEHPAPGAGAVLSDRLPEPTGRLIAARLNLIQAARAYVDAYGVRIGKHFWLDDNPEAQIVLPTSTGPTDHVGMLIVFPGKQLR